MKILFAVPLLDIRYEWLIGFTDILNQLKPYEYELYLPYRKPLHIADTLMARKAIAGNFDYVLRMDDDVWDVPPNAIEKLINADKDFISCVMYANGFPYQRCAFLKKQDLNLVDIARDKIPVLKEVSGTGILMVDMCAFPFTLIKTSVFKRLKEPWFEHTEEIVPDSYFCQKMLDAGIQPYVDMDLQVTHRGVNFWNRTQRFLAEAEYMIASGEMTEDHPRFKNYEIVRNKLIDSYTKKKLFVL